MTLEELNQQIKQGVLKHLYMFTGEELGVMDIYIEQLKKLATSPFVGADSVKGILPTVINTGFMSTPHFYIIRDDADFIKNGQVDKLEQLMEKDGGTVILIFNGLRKTTSLWKKNKANFVEFETLSADQLMHTVGLSINDRKISATLIDVCGNNLSRINLELNKAKHYAEYKDINLDDAVMELIENDIIYKPVDDITKYLAHALMQGNGKLTMKLLKQYKAGGDTPLKAIAFFHNGFRSLLALQLNGGTNNLETNSGVQYWKVKDLVSYQNKYSDSELIYALNRIQFVDASIKNGMIDADIALEYLTLTILRGC